MTDIGSKAAEFKVNKWGMSGIAAFLAAFLALAVCQKLFKNDRNACLVPYILLHLSAVTFGIFAAVRGNKWWFLMTLFAAVLAVQAFAGLIVE
ncbi:MAG: hypothetical protein WCA19_18130 [Candidatus Acidiferrales bacterium]